MNAPNYRGDKPTEFADEKSWNIPQNTAVYKTKNDETVEVKHLPLEEIHAKIDEFKAQFAGSEFEKSVEER